MNRLCWVFVLFLLGCKSTPEQFVYSSGALKQNNEVFLQQVKSQLPPELEPQLGPIATGLGEIFMYTVDAAPGARKPDGTAYTATDLRTLQDWVVRPQLRHLEGVTEVNTIGGFTRQIHVTPDPVKLAGGINAYQYVPNPTGWIDPLGLSANCPGPRSSSSPAVAWAASPWARRSAPRP